MVGRSINLPGVGVGATSQSGDLRGLVRAHRLSKATMSNIQQNLFWAFFFDVVGVSIAAGSLYPVFAILLSPPSQWR